MNGKDTVSVDGEDKRKELDYIQDIIKRMSNYQMIIKGGIVTLSTFFMAPFLKEGVVDFITTVPLFIFNILLVRIARKLDLKFLVIEKLYRSWFSFLADSRELTREYLFELNPEVISNVLETQGMKADDFRDEIEKSSKKSWAIKGFYNSLFLIIPFVYFCLIIKMINLFLTKF